MSFYNQYLNSSEEYKIKLDSNEIFMDVDDNVLMKMKSCLTNIQLHRYPDNEMKKIKELYGKYAGVNASNIIVGNGSDEMLELIISNRVENKSKILRLEPDFVMYDFYGKRFKGELIKYDIGKKMTFNVEDFIKVGQENNVDMIIFSNPNNPTGINIELEDIVKVLKSFKDKTVVVDEAYYEFNGDSMIPFIDEYKNLFVTRTLSKAWGLAALRVGFLISSSENIQELLNYKVPYTISSYSQSLAEVALRYPQNVIGNVKVIVKERELLYEKLKEIEKNAAMKIEFFKSKGNFIFGRTAHKNALIKGLENQGIYIRNFEGDSFRITVGSARENRKVIEAVRKIFIY